MVLIQLVSCVSSGSLRRQAVELHRLLIQPCVHRFTTLPPMRSERKHILLCPQSPCPHAAGVFLLLILHFLEIRTHNLYIPVCSTARKKDFIKVFFFPRMLPLLSPVQSIPLSTQSEAFRFWRKLFQKKKQFPISRFSSLCSPSWTTRSQEIPNLQRRATAPLWSRSRPTLWHQPPEI